MEMLLGIARDARVSASDRLKAITWALERAGFKGEIQVSLELKPWEQTIQSIFELASEDEVRAIGSEVLKRQFSGSVEEVEAAVKAEATAAPPVPVERRQGTFAWSEDPGTPVSGEVYDRSGEPVRVVPADDKLPDSWR
ncbi:hypothetical protein FHG89_25995 [Micromonospora orduensis]|uniref:Uncharacterized protein n=1 Tax=Micromonospora orduensis TaxID=1420891 RepID=A0A5C4QDK2_9ACTN|nr:hypothetical protein [Micromonospora orduensis]TNH23965.1 hypothetical protein FHG89_25995 [Micromonospora orduensis]